MVKFPATCGPGRQSTDLGARRGQAHPVRRQVPSWNSDEAKSATGYAFRAPAGSSKPAPGIAAAWPARIAPRKKVSKKPAFDVIRTLGRDFNGTAPSRR